MKGNFKEFSTNSSPYDEYNTEGKKNIEEAKTIINKCIEDGYIKKGSREETFIINLYKALLINKNTDSSDIVKNLKKTMKKAFPFIKDNEKIKQLESL